MHILFVDESGTPPHPGTDGQKYFVVGGIIIPETIWLRLRDNLHGMKIRRHIRGEFKWRYFSPNNVELSNPMRHCDRETRNSIREEIYRIICSDRAVKTIAAICSVPAAYELPSVTTQNDVYQLTYKTITERFQYHLQDVTRESGRKEYGLIIGDHRGSKDDKSLRAHHQKLIYSSAGNTSKYENLIEGLLLQPSHLSIGIQLADMVAGAVWRKYEREDEYSYNLMSSSLRCRQDGRVDGYGIIKVPMRNWR
tara:strand:+ start:489 stop:1244 length:756 start_codon:yes stop_codon:yes gene_type:complete